MKVADIMTKKPSVLKIEATLQDAAQLFLEQKYDSSPVVDVNGNLLGILDKNHLYMAIVKGTKYNSSIKDLILPHPFTLKPDDNVETIHLTDVFSQIPVVVNNKVVGIVANSDLTRLYFDELETVVNSTYNAIISIDSDENIQIFNPAAEKMLEKRRSDVVGAPFSSLFPKGKLPAVLESGKTEPTQKFEANGKRFVSNRTPINVDGKVIGAVAILQDVSDFEAISEELQTTKELKEEMHAIIESSFDGIFVTDADGKVLHANEAYSRITGVKLEEIIGKTMQELVEAGVYNQSVTTLVQEHLEPITLTQEIKTGKTVLVTGNPIFNKEGALFRVVTNVRDITELYTLKKEVEQAQGLSLHLQEQLKKAQLRGCEDFIIRSQKSKDLIDLVLRVSQVDSTVLIQGESGVGKEMIANILHSNGLRSNKPMIRINCGAIPENLLESELFGYEPGAFTGAQKNGKIGFFQLADGGTLFLDEIGELPLNLQVKLLRALQEQEITRVGGTRPIKIDVRIIAATNRNLWDMVLDSTFRKDLYYRLNVIPVYVPPLRERREEISALTYFFIKKLNNKYCVNKEIDEKALDRLIAYNWPGNVRELENVIERSFVTSAGNIISEFRFETHNIEDEHLYSISLPEEPRLKDAVEKLEESLILDALQQCKSTRKAAAKLGISQPTLVRKASRYCINLRDRFDD